MVIEVEGILEFSPPHRTKKHALQGEWKSHALIFTNCDIERYYRWFLKTRFNLELNQTVRGTHVTIISDKLEDKTGVFDLVRAKYDGQKITFYYELEPCSSGTHWWLRVHCPMAEIIRTEIGLIPMPYFPFHLTLGYAKLNYDKNKKGEDVVNADSKRRKEHSEYILDSCKRFNLISYEPRMPLESHQIISKII